MTRVRRGGAQAKYEAAKAAAVGSLETGMLDPDMGQLKRLRDALEARCDARGHFSFLFPATTLSERVWRFPSKLPKNVVLIVISKRIASGWIQLDSRDGRRT